MTVYSFYIFDRHTECIYSKRWAPRPTTATGKPTQTAPSNSTTSGTLTATTTSDGSSSAAASTTTAAVVAARKGLSASDDAKLIFGTVFSLRNMVRRLGGEDDSFISYRTSDYKLHYFETPTRLKFVMLTDTKTNNLRIVLQQIWANLYVPFVVMNPLSPVEHKGGAGVANEAFEFGLESFVTSMFPS